MTLYIIMGFGSAAIGGFLIGGVVGGRLSLANELFAENRQLKRQIAELKLDATQLMPVLGHTGLDDVLADLEFPADPLVDTVWHGWGGFRGDDTQLLPAVTVDDEPAPPACPEPPLTPARSRFATRVPITIGKRPTPLDLARQLEMAGVR